MGKMFYKKEGDKWYQSDEDDIMWHPTPKGFQPPAPKKHHTAAKMSLISLLAALSGFSIFKGDKSSETDGPTEPIKRITTNEKGEALMPFGFVDPDRMEAALRSQSTNSDDSVALPENLASSLPSLDTAESALNNSVSNQLFRSIQSVAPTNTSTNHLWLYTTTLQTLSTDTNGQCHAIGMPQTNFVHFVQMAQHIPTNQLQKVINHEPTEFSFNRIQSILHLSPQNAELFAQQSFLLSSRYQTTDRLFKLLPQPVHENQKNHGYFDSNLHFSLDAGIMIENGIHEDLLSLVRFHNLTTNAYLAIHPEDVACTNFSSGPTTLNIKDIDKLRADAEACGFGQRTLPSTYQKTYGLDIFPQDIPNMRAYRRKLIVELLSKIESRLEAKKTNAIQHESGLFGSHDNPIPTQFIDALLDFHWTCPNATSPHTNYLNRHFSKLSAFRHLNGILFRTWDKKKQCYVEQNLGRNNWKRKQIKDGIALLKARYGANLQEIMESTYTTLQQKDPNVQPQQFLSAFFTNAYALAQTPIYFHTIYKKDREQCFTNLSAFMVELLYPDASKAQQDVLQRNIVSALTQMEPSSKTKASNVSTNISVKQAGATRP